MTEIGINGVNVRKEMKAPYCPQTKFIGYTVGNKSNHRPVTVSLNSLNNLLYMHFSGSVTYTIKSVRMIIR